MIRSRSLVGIAHSARCAALARFNSQFTLEVFEAHAFAAHVLFVGATHRLDFLRQRVLDGDHSAALRYGDVSAKRVAQDFGAGASLAFARPVKFLDHLRRKRDRDGIHLLCAHGTTPYTRSKSVRSVTGWPWR